MNQSRVLMNETLPVDSSMEAEYTEESGIIYLNDLSDPKIRHALYKSMDRLLCRMNPLDNTTEMYALRNTIYALETEITMNRIIEINQFDSTEYNNLNNLNNFNNFNNNTSIPDAQPLDQEYIPFENIAMDMDSYVDDSESDNIYQNHTESLYTIDRSPFVANRFMEVEPLSEPEETPVYSTNHTGDLPYLPISISRTRQNLEQPSYFQNRTPLFLNRPRAQKTTQLFKLKRVSITEDMLKNSNKNMCSICLETPTCLQLAVSQCCMNIFCVSCIQIWEKKCYNKFMDSTCPLCRKISPNINIFCETRL